MNRIIKYGTIVLVILLIIAIAMYFLRREELKRSSFNATVVNIIEDTIEVKALENEKIYKDNYVFSISNIEVPKLNVGDKIKITFKGEVMETYPAKISNVTKIELIN